ncbi:MAG TPA: C40 family peptidase [Eubacteriales bacterium]|nr:C40 family peptidase [Eubacteriales bacterium]
MKRNKRKNGKITNIHNSHLVNFIFIFVAVVIFAFCLYGIKNVNALNETQDSGDISSPANEIVSPEQDKTDEQSTEAEISQNTYVTLTFARANVGFLNVRENPSTTANVLGFMDAGDMCLVADTIYGWYKIYYRGGFAYISSAFSEPVTMDFENETVANVVIAGAKMIGVEYVYGATRMFDSYGNPISGFSDDAFDCSSFTQYAYYMGAGIKIDVTTRTQVYDGVKSDDLMPGDLMFFTNSTRYYYEGIERIGHVGIYLGDNYILHTSSDFAVIEQISQTRWSYFIQNNRLIFD